MLYFEFNDTFYKSYASIKKVYKNYTKENKQVLDTFIKRHSFSWFFTFKSEQKSNENIKQIFDKYEFTNSTLNLQANSFSNYSLSHCYTEIQIQNKPELHTMLHILKIILK